MTPRSPGEEEVPRELFAERDIVSFGHIPWDGPWMSRHYVTSILAREHRVLNVATPLYVRDLLGPRHTRSTGLRQVAPRLWEYQAPSYLPQTYRAHAADALEMARAWHLRLTWTALRFRRPIYYVWEPAYLDLVRRLPPSFVCYHAYDKYSAFPWVGDPARVQRQERALLDLAHLVVATSKALADELSETSGKPAHYIPHGVDFARFDASVSRPRVPDDIASIPRPRIGYVGRMNEKLDLALLDSLTASRPNYSFVLVGPAGFLEPGNSELFDRITARSNVHVLGPKPHEMVPDYMLALDVGAVFYRSDGWAHFGNPLKMYEYLACGTPVVATALGSTLELGDYVRTASTLDEWLHAIDDCLEHDSADSRAARIDFARANTWEARVRRVSRLIECALAGAQRPGTVANAG